MTSFTGIIHHALWPLTGSYTFSSTPGNMRDRTRYRAGANDSGRPSCASVVSEPGEMICGLCVSYISTNLTYSPYKRLIISPSCRHRVSAERRDFSIRVSARVRGRRDVPAPFGSPNFRANLIFFVGLHLPEVEQHLRFSLFLHHATLHLFRHRGTLVGYFLASVIAAAMSVST